MEKRVTGVLFLLIGIAGFTLAGFSFMNGPGTLQNLSNVIIYAVCGMIFFLSGYEYVEASRNERRKASEVDESQ